MFYRTTVIFLGLVKTCRPAISLLITSSMLLYSNAYAIDDVNEGQKECAILLHGLARTSHSMDKMEIALQQVGYLTANIDYPSRSMKIQDLAPMALNEGIRSCRSQSATSISIVTHSMGGILARYYLAKNNLPELSSVVMLAPPNKGSLVTDRFRNEQWYKWVTGPAGQQLGTGKDGVPGVLGAVDYVTGVIAGDVHSPLDNWLAEVIPGEDDGKVSVDHTEVEGMTDSIVLPYTHISIMKEAEVIQQTLYFLKYNRFKHPAKL